MAQLRAKLRWVGLDDTGGRRGEAVQGWKVEAENVRKMMFSVRVRT